MKGLFLQIKRYGHRKFLRRTLCAYASFMILGLGAWPGQAASEPVSVSTTTAEAAQQSPPPVRRPLSRLFTTPQERVVLDHAKSVGDPHQAKQAAADAFQSGMPQQSAPDNNVQVKGLVVRARAAPVVWINDGNTLGSTHEWQELAVRFDSGLAQSLTFKLSDDRQAVALKPGVTWNRETGEIREHYLVSPTPEAVSTSVTPPRVAMPSDVAAKLPGSAAVQSVTTNAVDIQNIVDTISPDNRIKQAEAILRHQ